ncbi:MAG TPA: type IV pilus secretin PilQ [Betaproteobacteria bacterium]|nr:type IV pilus secretin PilQ [Betaproteobacteria bacterium]
MRTSQSINFSAAARLLIAAILFLFSGLAFPATGSPSAHRATAGGNSIDSLQYATLQNGKIVITVGLQRPLKTVPAGFTVDNPPRIALDFHGAANHLDNSDITVNKGLLHGLNVVQAGNRTRMVITLNQPAGYKTVIDGRRLLITLQPSEHAAQTTNLTTRFAEPQPGVQKHSLRDVNFRRGRDNAGRVIVSLSDSTTGIDIRKQGTNVVVNFNNTSLPKVLERRLDVTDFGTPVKTIDTFASGDNVRMIISPKGNWEYSAYQTDRRFTIEVRPAKEESLAAAKKAYTGEKLSLNFQNVEVRAVLQVIADFTGLNIVTSDSVTGNLTLRLKDVPWDQALDIILQSKGLAMKRSGNVIWIAPRDQLATQEKLALESQQQISALEPLQTESFQMKYQKAADVQALLSDGKQQILSKRGSVVRDDRTNTLFVQDTPSRLVEIRKLINKIDVPVKQVLIDARIVEANDNFSKNLGARLGVHEQDGQGASLGRLGSKDGRVVVGGQLADTGYHTGQIATVPDFNQSLNVNLPAAGLSGLPAGALSLVLFKAGANRFLNLELSALQADGKGKIISNPRVITSDQVEATIEQGTEIPYQQATSSGATSVSFKKATLSLKVKPQITPDNNIIMDLKVNKDSIGQNTAAGPAIDTKRIDTRVLVENGGTVVIGGIYQQTESNTVTKVPLFGDIPVVGFFFRNSQKVDNKSELLIFVTPRIVQENLIP